MVKSRKKPSKPEEFQNFITQKIQSEVCERGNYRIIKKNCLEIKMRTRRTKETRKMPENNNKTQRTEKEKDAVTSTVRP